MIKNLIRAILQNNLLLCLVPCYFIILIWWLKFQKKLQMKWQFAAVLSFAHLIIAVASMRILAIIEVGGDLEKAAMLRLYGAVFVIPPLYYIGAKITGRKTALVMDAAIVCGVIGLIFGRMNCLIAGCCQGTTIFPNGTMRWPIRELEMLYYFVFVIYYAPKVLHGKTHGQVCAVLFMTYGLMRFIFEWVREEFTTQIGVFHLAHIWSLIVFAIGAGIYYRLWKTKRTVRKTKKGNRNGFPKEEK